MGRDSAIIEVLSREEQGGESRRVDHRLSEDVVLAVVEDGTSRLMDLRDRFYGLPALSTTILTETLRYGSEEAARRVASEYGVPFERVKSDIDQFLQNLERSGLLEGPGTRDSRAWGIRRLALHGLLGIARLAKVASRPLRESDRVRFLLVATWLSLRLFGWASSVAALRVLFPRTVAPGRPDEWDRTIDRIDRLVRDAAARHVFPVECKERALCCWALLRSGGWPADLVVGVDLFPFLGHCWCESGDRTLSDDRHRCDRFVPVLRYR
jgi:hypothetical protein